MLELIRERRDLILSYREAVDINASPAVVEYWVNELGANLRDIKQRNDLASHVLRADDLAHKWSTIKVNNTSTYRIDRTAWHWR